MRASTAALANAEMDALDDTRIHPSSYEPATAMALSAVRERQEDLGDAARAAALERAMRRPHDVEDLDLEVRVAQAATSWREPCRAQCRRVSLRLR